MSLTEAQGYFDLGLYEEAWHSIDDQPAESRESRDAFGLRLKILAATERWQQCQYLAKGLVQGDPSWALPKLLGANALDKQGEIELALAVPNCGRDSPTKGAGLLVSVRLLPCSAWRCFGGEAGNCTVGFRGS